MVNGVCSIPVFSAALRSVSTSAEGALREFIVGPENEIVKHAVETLRTGDNKYNPIVFCGPAGSGKSFLALGLAEQDDVNANVVTTTGIDFARGFANAVETNAMDDFRTWYGSAGLFLLDDLESIGTKQAAQGELRLAIDQLKNNDAQIVITCRRVPTLLSSISSALASRLLAGLVVNFQLPQSSTRRVILERLSDSLQIDLPDGAVDLLADDRSPATSRLRTVPQLRHALVQLASQQDTAIDTDRIEAYLNEQVRRGTPSLRTIASVVGRYFRLKTSDLRGPKRQQHFVRARGLAMYLARRLTHKSLAEVGIFFGDRDHTTVLHACRKTEKLIGEDFASKQAADDLLNQLAEIQDDPASQEPLT